ncbi:YfhE family protein [Salipaludibacillus neizhouensis]|uniref:YfhE family protein n=1 Tax=Salipaludibacillus neizhouensis TaxID=885475 RepID=A0A3A9JZX7_9BACI|nr:YfhE family protein [Salipaludibacillus neizhouensis]RKL65709.1 YfhE family protein [Salipaludibacillus neizhouensis]
MELHHTLTKRNNGLSSAQEVHYSRDFKKAEKAARSGNSK